VTDNNNVLVTNNTASSAVILDAYGPASTPGIPEANQVYALPMTLRTTSSGSTTIGTGASGSVVLDPARMIYDLVFARPADLFPLQNSAVMQNIIFKRGGSIDKSANFRACLDSEVGPSTKSLDAPAETSARNAT
jgi:hypothetical protein